MPEDRICVDPIRLFSATPLFASDPHSHSIEVLLSSQLQQFWCLLNLDKLTAKVPCLGQSMVLAKVSVTIVAILEKVNLISENVSQLGALIVNHGAL